MTAGLVAGMIGWRASWAAACVRPIEGVEFAQAPARSRAHPGEDIMAKYLLVSFKTCPWVQRAAIVLREKNIAVRVPPYRAGQPARLVPRHLAAQEGAGAAHRRQGVAVRVERDQRIPRRDDRAAAAPGRSDPARHQPRLDRLCADLRRARHRRRLCRRRGRLQRNALEQDTGGVRAARKALWKSKAPDRSSTARSIRWSMPPTRRSCSAISSSTGSGRSA